MWIAIVCGSDVIIKHLTLGEEPVARFEYNDNIAIYAYCNIHGLWKKDLYIK